MTNTILQIIKIDADLLDEIKDSFNHLPETDHADGKYRLRKYSRVRVTDVNQTGKISVVDCEVDQFTQSEKYNKHQGGMLRKFENIDPSVISGSAMKEMARAFMSACNVPNLLLMDVHQMRVKCSGGATQLSPEGWHQDGYDNIAMIGGDRNNIIGGELLLSTHKTESPFLQATLDTGTMMIVDDSHLWHNGRSIQPIKDDEPAWMDVIVFTSKKILTKARRTS